MPSGLDAGDRVLGDLEDPNTSQMPSSTRRKKEGPRQAPSFASCLGSFPKAIFLALQACFVLCCFIVLLRRGLVLSEEYKAIAPGLRPGLLGGRRVDVSDVQWRGFRESLVPLALVFSAFAGVSRLLQARDVQNSCHNRQPVGRPEYRVIAMVASSVAFLLYLHGRCALYVYGLVSVSWALTRWLDALSLASWMKTSLAWAWHVGVLMLVKGTDGFLGVPVLDGAVAGWMGAVGRMLGRGVFRWEICYNMTMLRLVSQSLDVLWGVEGAEAGGYWLAIAHALYPPLYLAGPVITYADFVGQVVNGRQKREGRESNGGAAGTHGATESTGRVHTQRGPTSSVVCRYAIRTLFDIVIIELMSHHLYFNSIATNNLLTERAAQTGSAEKSVSPLDVATCGWWVLAFTWLKFCVIWRFFRLAALLEGITPPENMRKCFAMNYDVQGFWKNWHASFNRWLVRYMYIPAGGSRGSYQLLLVWPIFVFVALWHDVEIRLLGWAGLMILAFMPELIVKGEFARSRWDWVRREHATALWILKSLAATITISSLMIGNMVGFVVGLDGVGAFLTQLLGSPTLVVASLVSFFSAASLMITFEDWLYFGR